MNKLRHSPLCIQKIMYEVHVYKISNVFFKY